MTASLRPEPGPTPASLEFYRKQARALLKAVRAGDAAAAARLDSLPKRRDPPTLGDAQWLVAREQGFSSWPRLKRHLEAQAGLNLPERHLFESDPAWHEDRAASLVSVHEAGLPAALSIIQRFHPRFSGGSLDAIGAAEFSLDDARLTLARQHGCEGWDALLRRVEALAEGKEAAPFRDAFTALQAGDEPRFAALLREHPWLVGARGTNGNSLLCLAASLGRRGLVRTLLAAGADVDLANDRGWTALHQAAYANDRGLGEILLAAGAAIDMNAHGDGGTPLFFALFWGNREMAERLALAGVVPDNLRTAAGLGDLARLRSFFDPRGRLLPPAGAHRAAYRPHSGFPVWHPSGDPQEILDEALTYAARSDRPAAMAFLVERGARPEAEPYNGGALHWAAGQGKVAALRWLLDHGAAVDSRASMGQPKGLTPLHCAAWAGHVPAVRLLVERGADLQATDPEYGGTPLGWARYHGRPAAAEYLQAAMG